MSFTPRRNNRQNLNIDNTQPGAMVPVSQMSQMLGEMQRSSLGQNTPIDLQTTDTAPIEVRYINTQVVPRRRVPEMHVPVTDYWKAHRFHPHNNWRYYWYIYYLLRDAIASPIGVWIVMFLLASSAIGFLLNGSYQGPGYVAKKAIKLDPKDLPDITPIIHYLD